MYTAWAPCEVVAVGALFLPSFCVALIQPAWLLCSVSPQGSPVVDVDVVYDDEVPADGFRKLPHDLTKGGDAPVYIVYRTEDAAREASSKAAQHTADDNVDGGGDGDGDGDGGAEAEADAAAAEEQVPQPLTELLVLFSTDDAPLPQPEGAGWHRVSRSLTRDSTPGRSAMLWYKRREAVGAWLCCRCPVLLLCGWDWVGRWGVGWHLNWHCEVTMPTCVHAGVAFCVHFFYFLHLCLPFYVCVCACVLVLCRWRCRRR